MPAVSSFHLSTLLAPSRAVLLERNSTETPTAVWPPRVTGATGALCGRLGALKVRHHQQLSTPAAFSQQAEPTEQVLLAPGKLWEVFIEQFIGIFEPGIAQRRGADSDPNTPESLYPVGVTASVINRQTQVDGVLKVKVSGLQRTAIVRLINDEFLSAEVVPIEEGRGQSAEAAILCVPDLRQRRVFFSSGGA
jgi:ATP-dependent protease La (LON) substrate-binding domain